MWPYLADGYALRMLDLVVVLYATTPGRTDQVFHSRAGRLTPSKGGKRDVRYPYLPRSERPYMR